MHWWHSILFGFIALAAASQIHNRQVDPGQIVPEGAPAICKAWCEVVAGEYNNCKTSSDPTCFCRKKSFKAFENCGNCILAAQNASKQEVLGLQKTYSSLSNICIASGKASSPIVASTVWRNGKGAVAVVAESSETNSARDLLILNYLALGASLVIGAFTI